MNLLSKELDAYIDSHTRARPALLDELREYTYANVERPGMQVGKVEGTFLKTLVALARATHVIEIGTFTGYSALCMAEGLPETGRLVTCDINPETSTIAQRFFDRSPHGRKIEIRLGAALDTLKSLSETQPFDLAFIDADKTNYANYYEAILPLLSKGGLIVADNTLWSGEVVNPQSADARALDAFNVHVTRDARVENVLLSVRDGMMLARKL